MGDEDEKMKEVITSRILRTILLLIAVCLLSIPAEAQYGGGSGTTASAETSTYVFLSDQSTVVQTGGIAGVHETYPIEGQFQLTVDANAGVASFDYVDAFLLSPISSSPPQSLGELFNMTSLLGEVLDDTTISFTGKTADGSDVLITLTIEDDLAYLVGQTIPPPNTADFFLFSLDAVAQRKYGGGTGAAHDPYMIYTAEQMNAIGADANDWDKHFKLMADIDLGGFTGTAFNIIGPSYGNPFGGVFDGNGKTIANFKYTCIGTDRIGLFGCVAASAQIKDLGLIDPNVDAGTGSWVGSLVGYMDQASISNCYVEGGSVSGNDHVGGLVGSGGPISNCHATARISGSHNIGGLVGYNWDIISNCYTTASVSGGDTVGGLLGWNNGTINNCYSTSNVTGNYLLGGLVGVNDKIITNCYSSGDISGGDKVGGLAGGQTWDGTIANCYSTGSVSGNEIVGGLVVENYGGSVTASFWDIQTSGQSTSAGGTGKTTTEMQNINTYLNAGWDFVAESVNGTEDIWSICEGTNYPRFVWQIPPGDFVCPDGITIDDFEFFTEYWLDDNCDLSNDYCQGTDLDFSGTVDVNDLEIFFENWLAVAID